MKLLALFVVTVLFTSGYCAENIPDYVTICHRSDPKVDDCILNSINALRSRLVSGVPESGVPQLDPLKIGKVVISDKAKTGFGLTVTNVVATGGRQYEVSDLKVNSKDNVYEFTVKIPSLQLKGEYNVDGEILRLPVKGNGPFNGEFTGITTLVKMKAEVADKDGHKQLIIKKIRIRIQVQNGKLKAENLFNGDANLGNAINDLINDNFNTLSQGAIPEIEKILEQRIKEIANALAARYDYDQYFPE